MALLSYKLFRYGLSILNKSLEVIFSQNLFIFISRNRVVTKSPPFILIFGALLYRIEWWANLFFLLSFSSKYQNQKLALLLIDLVGWFILLINNDEFLLLMPLFGHKRFYLSFSWYQRTRILILVSMNPHILC